ITQFVAGLIAPRDLKLLDVARVHLFQRRIVGTVGAAQILAPPRTLLGLRSKRGQNEERECNREMTEGSGFHRLAFQESVFPLRALRPRAHLVPKNERAL